MAATIKTKFTSKKIVGLAKRHLKRNMSGAALFLQGKAQEEIRTPPKSGRIYVRGARRHQASAPGEAPASDTGRLIGSATFEVFTTAKSVVGVVIFNVGYAEFLEVGTARMAARPYLRPALAKNRKAIGSLLARP